MRRRNFILCTDSYKQSHESLYPEGTQSCFVYAEARMDCIFENTVFFGLHYFLKEYFAGVRITAADIEEARSFLAEHFNSRTVFEEYRWQHILQEHGGMLPLIIKAVPEGTVVPKGNVLFTVQSTCSECYWLPGFCDTILTQLWGPIAVATNSYAMKKTLNDYLDMSSDTPEAIDFMLHDFGYRGSWGTEGAALSGAAHLVNFVGSDTLPAISLIKEHYGESMAGFSVPATEHSVTIAHDDEGELIDLALTRFPTGILSIVVDSYNTDYCVNELIGKVFRERIQKRQGKVVVRPDSGEPTIVLPAILGSLGNAFGYRTNMKGYKVLPPYIGVIQGDHVYRRTLIGMCLAVVAHDWSIENMVFGCGTGLRDVDRNDLSFVMKLSSIVIGNQGKAVSKKPITDMGKQSKAGVLQLLKEQGVYRTVRTDEGTKESEGIYLLREVFRNGSITSMPSFRAIRERARAGV